MENNVKTGTGNSALTANLVTPSSAQSTNVSFQSLPMIDLHKLSGKFSDWDNFRDVNRFYEIALSTHLHYR